MSASRRRQLEVRWEKEIEAAGRVSSLTKSRDVTGASTARCVEGGQLEAQVTTPSCCPRSDTLEQGIRTKKRTSNERYLSELGHRPDPHQVVARLGGGRRTGSSSEAGRYWRDNEPVSVESRH